ncbi:hypothetical protein ACWCPF_41835 [Streptomyces sp. NPDC001858]
MAFVAGALAERVHALAARHTAAPPASPMPARTASSKTSRSR